MNYIVKFYENFEDAKSGKNLAQWHPMTQEMIDSSYPMFNEIIEHNGNSIYEFMAYKITIETDEEDSMRYNRYHFKSDENHFEILDNFDVMVDLYLN